MLIIVEHNELTGKASKEIVTSFVIGIYALNVN